jgi:Acetylornithine deacetylase/Succinyl-diaminopimelate desuccinylase and related deacylases
MWSLQTVTIPTQRCGAVGILALQRGEDVNPGASGDLTANRFELWPLYPYMDLSVDADRLRANLEANAEFGRIASDDPEERGRTNRTGTEANGQARDRLVDRFDDAGLDVAVDAVGNLVGTWTPDSADPDAAPVASGSHLDSVPEGGIFDGPLGVYAALEAVRAMQDAGVEPARPVAVVSFTEEEGATFGNGCSGRASRPERSTSTRRSRSKTTRERRWARCSTGSATAATTRSIRRHGRRSTRCTSSRTRSWRMWAPTPAW